MKWRPSSFPMAAVQPSEDPLTRALESPTAGTAESRAALHNADALARQTSNEIDDWLKKEATKRSDRQVRMLLLGMSVVLLLPNTCLDCLQRSRLQGQAESGQYSPVYYYLFILELNIVH
jgi:hypothetical protein